MTALSDLTTDELVAYQATSVEVPMRAACTIGGAAVGVAVASLPTLVVSPTLATILAVCAYAIGLVALAVASRARRNHEACTAEWCRRNTYLRARLDQFDAAVRDMRSG